jgi:class 3 adenylate cyclase/tetratricopeptide (TPR) repeat protein
LSVNCPACGVLNEREAAFCGGCGVALGPICPSCGAGPLPTGVAFCTACGTELARPGVLLERKIVSVVFVDLVGYTAMSEALDPEEVRRLLGPYYQRVREELEGYGGTVEKFIGDAVMALFGAPVAHEDDAERAVRAGYAVLQAVRRLPSDGTAAALRVRIGIATGEAVVDVNARPQEGEATAHGDVVNTAARLQSGAPADGILVDERTYRATRFQIDFRPEPLLLAKGKAEPVPVWSVVQPRARTGADPARLQRPLVGRARETQVLIDALARAVAGGEPQIVTLVGPPGIGKSRQVWQLAQHLERETDLVFWRQGRSLPYGDGVTFWALGEIVKANAGILATDPNANVEQKLRIAVEDVVDDANEARWIGAHLAPLAGLTSARELRGDRRTEAFAAWRRFLELIAARRPLVLVFEDIHWADDGLLEFITDHLGDRFTGPLLVVATSRPELLDRRPQWAGAARSTMLELQPLSDQETADVVTNLLDAAELPPELRSALLARAGGNPLFAEEYVRMLLDRGLLRSERSGPELTGSDLPLPESVQSIIAARLDALPSDEKLLLQDAAVVGRAFWLGALAEVGQHQRWSVEHMLHELERKQLLRRESDSIVLTEPQYAFSHALVRDVAYEQIPRARRSRKHWRAAGWIESLSPERTEDRAEMLSHHYMRALRYLPQGETVSPQLLQAARSALCDAGDRSMSLNAFAEAARFFAEALQLWPEQVPGRADVAFRLGSARVHAESGGDRPLEQARDAFIAEGQPGKAAEAMVLIGELLWMRGSPDAFRHLDEAGALLRDTPASYSKAYVLSSLSRFHMIADENLRSIEVGQEALAMAEEMGLDELRAHALDSIGISRARIGDERGIADLEQSIALAVAHNSLESVRGYANLGNAMVEYGDLARAFEVYQQGRDAAQRFGDVDRILWFEVERMYECYWRGRWGEAQRLADEIVSQVDAGSPSSSEHDARLVRARIRLGRGQEPLALGDSTRALELGRHAGYPEMLVPSLALQARVLEAAGRRAEASQLADELLGIWPGRCPTSYWVSDLAFTLRQLDRPDTLAVAARSAPAASRWLAAGLALAAGDAAAAAEKYAEIGCLPDEATARLFAARAALAAGGRAAAEAQLRQALETFRQLAATRYLREAEALMAIPA